MSACLVLFAPYIADVTEHGCLTTVAATPQTAQGQDPDVELRHDETGQMVSSISELDESAVARAMQLMANGTKQ